MPENALQEEFYEEKTVEEAKQSFLNFFLNEEWYGIELQELKEILPVPKITRLPGSPSHVIGLANYRGSVLPVVDLKRVFGLNAGSPNPARRRLLVTEQAEKIIGLLVDAVGGVVDCPKTKIDPPLSTLSGPAAGFIKGEAHLDEKILGIIETSRLFNKEGKNGGNK